MCTRGDCVKNVGNWVQFRSPWGYHRGVIEAVNNRAVLVRMPRQYVPSGLIHYNTQDQADTAKLDVALAQWGYGPGYGYGGYGGWGYPGYGYWGGGWWWWWLAFAWIFALAFLW